MGGARDCGAKLQQVHTACSQPETQAAVDDVVHRPQRFLADPHWLLLKKGGKGHAHTEEKGQSNQVTGSSHVMKASRQVRLTVKASKHDKPVGQAQIKNSV